MESNNTNDILMKILTNHQVPVEAQGDHVEILGTDVRVQSKVFRNAQAAREAIHLDIVVQSPKCLGNCAIVEAFAGIGSTLDDAVHDAFDKFCRASLHVIMAVIINRSLGEEQVDWEYWANANHGWDVCLGPLLLQEGQPREANDESWNYDGLLDAFRDAFLKGASYQTHWLRCFRGCLDGQCIGREVLLDNDPWPTGEEILDRWPFPNRQGYYSMRQFLIALPGQPNTYQ